MENIKNSFRTRKFKSASYSFGVIAVALAIVVVVNLIVNALPANITKMDLSFNQMYSLTDTTEEFVRAMDKDVTIYVVAQTGGEDEDVMEMLDKYKALSSRITVETVDPVLHPTFTTQYTEETVTSGSLIVESAERFTIVPSADLYETTFNSSTYATDITGFDVEGQVTSALNYVTTEVLPVVYTVQGHGETALTETLMEQLGKNSIEIEILNLLTSDGIPEDAAGIIINAPTSDFSKEDAEKITEYLKDGGRALIVSAADGTERENLNSILSYYGTKFTPGYAIENSSSNYYRPYPYYLVPVKGSHAILSGLKTQQNLFLPYAEAIELVADTRESVGITSLLTTTEDSFLRTIANSSVQTISMAEGDIAGPITVGAAISEVYDEVETRLVVYSSPYIMEESANNQVSGNNYDLVNSSLTWLCGLDSSIAIDAKSFSLQYLQLTANATNCWTIITLVLLPVLCIGTGFVVWMRRRRR